MSIEFRLPDLGENVTEGEVIRVLVKEGEVVRANQTVMELETDKALLEVPSPAGGKVTKLFIAPGRKLKVNEMILTLEPDAASAAAPAPTAKPAAAPSSASAAASSPISAVPPSHTPSPTPTPSAPSPAPSPVAAPPPAAAPPPENEEDEDDRESARVVEVARGGGHAAAAAPSTRRLARELGVDLAQVKGTGEGGRITQEDVRAFVRGKTAETQSAPAKTARVEPASAASPPLPDFSKWGPVERKPLSNVRKATMAQLALSWRLIPHVTQFDEVDVTDLEALRQRHSERAAARGGKLTATVFVMKAVVAALKAFPQFNASIDTDTQELILKSYYHLGIAVDTDHGLIVPVIRDVDQKRLLDLSTELSLASERTRQRKVTLEDLRGGTFTISNLGGIGGVGFTPIINWPEVAILGLARYQKRLMLKGDRMETRTILPLSLSYDHRIIDGADGVRFTRKIAAMLEDPALLLLEP